MKPFLKVVAILVLLVSAESVLAQAFDDALRLSRYSSTGTARSQGLAGANSAVGGDFSSAALNPAGLGLYRSTEFGISLGIQTAASTSNFIDQKSSSNRVNFAVPNFGIVIYGRKKYYTPEQQVQKFPFRSWSLGFGMNQVDSWHQSINITAFNKYNSFTNFFEYDASRAGNPNINSLPYYSQLGYNAVLLDTVKNKSPREYIGGFNDGKVDQNFTRTLRGRYNEWSIAFAGNWGDNLFVGVSLNIADVYLLSQTTITETDTRNLYQNWLSSAGWSDTYTTSGWGIGATIGAIYQPVKFFRFGVSFRTPSALFLTDRYSTFMLANFDDNQTFSASSDAFNVPRIPYQVNTPLRATLGVAFFIKKLLMFTADADITDYRMLNYGIVGSTPSYVSYKGINQLITGNFQLGYSIRTGVEFRFKSFYLRGGFAIQSSATKPGVMQYNELNTPSQTRTVPPLTFLYSGGVGYRTARFFFDAAVVAQDRTDAQSAYSVDPSFYQSTGAGWVYRGVNPTIETRRLYVQVLMTVGFRILPKR